METMGLEGGVDVVARGMSRDLAPQVRKNLKNLRNLFVTLWRVAAALRRRAECISSPPLVAALLIAMKGAEYWAVLAWE